MQFFWIFPKSLINEIRGKWTSVILVGLVASLFLVKVGLEGKMEELI